MTSRRRDSRALLLSIGAALAVSAMAVCAVMLDNPGEIPLGDVARASIALAILAVSAPVLLFLAGGAFRYAAIAFPLALFFLFKLSVFYSAAVMIGLSYNEAVAASAAAMMLLYLAAMQTVRRRDAAQVAMLMLVVFGSAAAVSIGNVSLNNASERQSAQAALSAFAPHVPEIASGLDQEALPDVIYIVPDRYGNAEAIESAYGVREDAFLTSLEARGFYVERQARSNYPKTFQSLASTLNMTNLAPLAEAMGPDAQDHKPIYTLLRDNAVQRNMRSLGYSYLHLGSWWQPTRRNPASDEEFYGIDNFWSRLNEFEHALLRMTPLASLATIDGFVDRQECSRLKNQLDRLETARRTTDGPSFTFVHLMAPHDPITMDASGNCLPHVIHTGGDSSWKSYSDAYSGYVRYLNKRLLEIFDSNKSIDNGRPFIFVVQADEGPYPRRLHEKSSLELFGLRDAELRTKLGIINAVYWDTDIYGPPYLTVTPVNNWRIIFSKITGTNMPLIEDERSIIFRSDEQVYDMRDVSSIFAN